MRLTLLLLTKRKYDLVVLGATGFTGRYVAKQMCKTVTKDNANVSWAIAGRNKDKLAEVTDECSKQTGIDASNISVIDVDINDQKSLRRMCEDSSLIVNCCGPYRLLGEQVVDACVNTGCHHIDVSGEPQFLENVQYKYHDRAVRDKVAIVGSCGFDSVPADLGVQFLKSRFDGTLDSVEMYLRVSTTSDKPVTYNFATWHSLVYGYAFRHQLSKLRKQLYGSQFKTYEWKHGLKRESIVRNQYGYCVPFPGSDRSVVQRTQFYNYTQLNERPVQMQTYFTVNHWAAVMALVFVNASVSALAPYQKGRQLLMEYPNIFSCGVFNKRAKPLEETLKKNSFEIYLVGRGWPDKYPDPTYQPSEAPNKVMTARISGGDLAYLDTSAIVTQIALTLLDLKKQNKLKFGVFTPSIALKETSILEKLSKYGIKFETVIGDPNTNDCITNH